MSDEKQLVAGAVFKGKHVNGQIEIAYGTFYRFRKKGVGTIVCKLLVELSLETDQSIIITARTLPEKIIRSKYLKRKAFRSWEQLWIPKTGKCGNGSTTRNR